MPLQKNTTPTKAHLLELAEFIYSRYESKKHSVNPDLEVTNNDEIIELRTNHDYSKG